MVVLWERIIGSPLLVILSLLPHFYSNTTMYPVDISRNVTSISSIASVSCSFNT